MKPTRHLKNLVAFPSVHWDFNWERQHNMITHLSESAQNRVVVHAPYGLINHSFGTILAKLKARKLATNSATTNPRHPKMNFVSPKFLPFHYHPFLDRINASIIEKATPVPLSESLGYFTYVNGAMLQLLPKFACSVLDIAQRRQAIPELSEAAKATERLAVKMADIVIVDSISTYNDYKDDRNDIHYLPQGVDVARFAQGQIDASILEWKNKYSCVVGYVGSDLAVDVPYLRTLIQQLPYCGFLLVGHFDRPEMQQLKTFPNVLMAGRIRYDALPNYYAAIDIGLIPYVLTERILGVFPTKFFEYLAAGAAVISTPLPDLQSFEQAAVVLEKNPTEAVKAILELQKTGWERAAVQQLANQHTWQSRFQQIDEWIQANNSAKTS